MEDVKSRARMKNLMCEIIPRTEKLYMVTIGVRSSYEIGYLIVDKEYWLFLSDGEGWKIKNIMRSFLKRVFPMLRFGYIKSNDLLELVEELGENYEIVKFLDGTYCKEGETSRKWRTTPLSFSIERLSGIVENEQAKWTGISFSCYIGGKEEIKARIYDRGHLTLYKGNFSNFYSDIVLKFGSKCIAVSDTFSNKQRRLVDGKVVTEPIELTLKENLNIGEIENLKRIMIRNYSSGVIYSGNPILLVQIADARDGSIFDVYAYKNKIKIVPLTKASRGALTEVFALISDTLPTATPTQ